MSTIKYTVIRKTIGGVTTDINVSDCVTAECIAERTGVPLLEVQQFLGIHPQNHTVPSCIDEADPPAELVETYCLDCNLMERRVQLTGESIVVLEYNAASCCENIPNPLPTTPPYNCNNCVQAPITYDGNIRFENEQFIITPYNQTYRSTLVWEKVIPPNANYKYSIDYATVNLALNDLATVKLTSTGNTGQARWHWNFNGQRLMGHRANGDWTRTRYELDSSITFTSLNSASTLTKSVILPSNISDYSLAGSAPYFRMTSGIEGISTGAIQADLLKYEIENLCSNNNATHTESTVFKQDGSPFYIWYSNPGFPTYTFGPVPFANTNLYADGYTLQVRINLDWVNANHSPVWAINAVDARNKIIPYLPISVETIINTIFQNCTVCSVPFVPLDPRPCINSHNLGLQIFDGDLLSKAEVLININGIETTHTKSMGVAFPLAISTLPGTTSVIKLKSLHNDICENCGEFDVYSLRIYNADVLLSTEESYVLRGEELVINYTPKDCLVSSVIIAYQRISPCCTKYVTGPRIVTPFCSCGDINDNPFTPRLIFESWVESGISAILRTMHGLNLTSHSASHREYYKSFYCPWCEYACKCICGIRHSDYPITLEFRGTAPNSSYRVRQFDGSITYINADASGDLDIVMTQPPCATAAGLQKYFKVDYYG